MSGLSQQQSPPSRSGTRPSASGTSRPPTQQPPSQPSQSTDGASQGFLNDAVFKEYVLNISRCNTIGELVRLIPVPVQPVSRDILDGVYQASQKLGGAEALHLLWQDKLRSSDFATVSQLNSMRAPVVQISKEALGSHDNGLSSMNLDTVLHDSKKSALIQMIRIKGQEVSNLRDFIQIKNIGSRLRDAWNVVLEQQAGAMTSEHGSLILSDDFVGRVAQVAASIGESSFQRVRISKQKRSSAKKEADIMMTDASSHESKRQMISLVEEALKRKEQSQRDRTRSGKGKGSSATSKKKTQRKGRTAKPKGTNGPPTRQQQKRRWPYPKRG